ncbi:MAG: PfkB family carbohydrate kinase, partial [Bacteroidales bacterium]
LFSLIGNDNNANILIDVLQKKNIETSYILYSDTRPTTTKTRIICGSQHALRVDEEICDYISQSETQLLIDAFCSFIEKEHIDALVFEDYDKGVLTPELIKIITQICNNKKIPIAVDPKKKQFLNYEHVQLFKPNFKELCEGLKLTLQKNEIPALIEHCQEYRKQKNIEQLMVTLSEYGIIICTRNETLHIPANIRKIADVSGAGDTVLSVAVLCITANATNYETAYLSNLAGGLVCEEVGVVSITAEKLLQNIQNIELQNIKTY